MASEIRQGDPTMVMSGGRETIINKLIYETR
jgi:hypothetical protein